MKKCSTGSSKLHSTYPNEQCKERWFFWKKSKFFEIFASWAKKTQLLVKNFSARVSKINFTAPKKVFEKYSSSEKSLFFSSFADCEQKFFGFWSKNSLGVVKTAFYVSTRTLFGRDGSFKIFKLFSGHWAKSFWPIVKFFSTGLSKLHSICPKQVFWKAFLLKKIYSFYHYRTLIKKHSASGQKNFFCGVSKLHSTCPPERFSER